MDTGYAIRFCRQQRQLSIPELASRAGLSKSYVSLLERNERDPPLSTIEKLASAMRVPLGIFVFIGMSSSELEGIPPAAADKLAAATIKLLKATNDPHNDAID